MSTKRFHFYHAVTGLFHAKTVVTNYATKVQEFALGNAPEGHKPIEGEFDPMCQKVDPASGQVVDYQPPRPSSEHAWDPKIKRWVKSPEATARDAEVGAVQDRIDLLDRQSIRALREDRLGQPDAHDRLIAIDAEIAALRATLEKSGGK